jgi:hypothetical protein
MSRLTTMQNLLRLGETMIQLAINIYIYSQIISYHVFDDTVYSRDITTNFRSHLDKM